MVILIYVDSYDEGRSLQGRIIGGCSIRHWLNSIGMSGGETEKTLWQLLHLCLLFYDSHGLYIRRKVFQNLFSLAKRLYTQMQTLRKVNFMKYMYYFIVVRFGHFGRLNT